MKIAICLAVPFSLCCFACHIPVGSMRVGTTAIDLNKTLERAHNEILLLNVVRSSKRMPQHWSALTVLRDTENIEVSTGGIGIPFGGGADSDDYSASPSARWSTAPGMEMAVQISAEFTRGIMQPIDLQQLQYFLTQGWPAGFVFHLSVREIRVTRQWREADGEAWKEVTKAYENRPDPENGFEGYHDFVNVLEGLVEDNLRVVRREPGDAKDRSFTLESADGEELAELQRASFKLSVNERGQVVAVAPASAPLALRIDDEIEHDQDLSTFTVQEDANTKTKYTIVLRSPEGLVYFLGQLVRVGSGEQGFHATYEDGGRRRHLFNARRGRPREAAAVSVVHDGERYLIQHASDDDRSLMTLTFASVLVNLNRSRKDLPTSSIVAIGGS